MLSLTTITAVQSWRHCPVSSDQDLDSSYNGCTLDREARHQFRLKSGEWWQGDFTWRSITCGHT
jgi:hypothetical protein